MGADEVELGEVLGGYRLAEELGAGSTSTVFRGEHVRLGRWAAVKVLSPDLVNDRDVRARMFTEAKVVNDIRHPNIVDVTDFVEQDAPARVALIMEHIPGPSLRAFRGAPLPKKTTWAIARQMVSALSAAHNQGVIHRDLKPDNVLLMSDPRDDGEAVPMVKVVDFGIAKVAGPGDHARTAFGTLLGTPAYMAPEQVAGSPPPSSGTDVYALSEIVYELVTGDRLFSTQKTEETVRRKLRGEHPDVNLPAGLEDLAALITRSLHARAERRPTLVEWSDLLAAIEAREQQGESAPPRPAPIPDDDTGAATQLAGLEPAVTRADKPGALPEQATELAELGGGLMGHAGLATGSSDFPSLEPPRDEATASGESWEASSLPAIPMGGLNELPLTPEELPPPIRAPEVEIDDALQTAPSFEGAPEEEDTKAPQLEEPSPRTSIDQHSSPAEIFSSAMAEDQAAIASDTGSSKAIWLAFVFVGLAGAALALVVFS